MSLFSELKKRNVIRTAVTYLVISWLLIQVGNVLFSTLELDASANKMLLAFLILGFVPAVLFSWAYEITPEGIKHERELERNETYTNLTAKRLDILTIVLVLMAMLMFGFDKLTGQDSVSESLKLSSIVENNGTDVSRTPNLTETVDKAPAHGGETSIAVLPFVNMSPNQENEYFSDGISEEILNALVRIDGLQVASRTSSFSFKENTPDIPTVAKALRVNHIVEGSVRRAGEQVRITAQLIEVSSDKHLWSETYTRKLEDVFAIQDEISAAIADALELTLRTRRAEIYTDSIEAYDIYLQGRAKLREANAADRFDEAVALFDQALFIDPEFAEAQAGRCQAFLGKFRNEKDTSLIDRAIAACDKAIILNPDAPEVLVTQGELYFEQGQNELALSSYNKAIELLPNFAKAYSGKAAVLDVLGDIDAAVSNYSIAIELQPDNSNTYGNLGVTQFNNGRLAEAADNFLQAIQLSPEVANNYSNLGGVYFFMGDFGKAAATFERSIAISPNANAYSNAGTNYYYQGEYKAAYSMFKEAAKQFPKEFLFKGNLADSCRLLTDCEQNAENLYNDALGLLEKELQVNNSNAENLSLKALYLARLERYPEAKEQLDLAIKLDKQNPNILYTAALIYAANNDDRRTRDFINKALQSGFPDKALRADPDLKKFITRE